MKNSKSTRIQSIVSDSCSLSNLEYEKYDLKNRYSRNSVIILLTLFIFLIVAACNDQSTSPTSDIETPISVENESDFNFNQGKSPQKIPGQYIIVFKDEVQDVPGLAKGLVNAHGGTMKHTYQYAIKGFSVSKLPPQAITALERNPHIAYIEQDGIVYGTSHVTQTNATWGLDRIDQRDLPLNDLYQYQSTGAGVTAYVIDSGIRSSHQEFGGRVIQTVKILDDEPGHFDDYCHPHGTHVAGTIGGETFGVAKDVSIVNLWVLNCANNGSWADIIAAVDWVTNDYDGTGGAVANMSLGGGFNQAANDAVANSVDEGVTYVLAAGNDNINACTRSPASEPKAITVGSTTNTDARSGFSNFGECVDIFAPGSEILSAGIASDTDSFNSWGTSMAAPHVAGVAALYLENNSSASPATVWSAIESSATVDRITNVGTNSPNLLLYSLFDNVSATVTINGNPSPSSFGEQVTFTATVRDNSPIVSGTVTFLSEGSCAAPVTILSADVALNANGEAQASTSTLLTGNYTIRACYSGADGFNPAQASTIHTVNPAATQTTLTINPNTRQYSDQVNLTAVVTPSSINGISPTGNIDFQLYDGVTWNTVASTAIAGGQAMETVQVTSPAGAASYRAVFTSTNTNFSDSQSDTEILTVTLEDAIITYLPANPSAIEVSTEGGDLNIGELVLSIEIQENETTVGMALPGDIGNANISVNLIPVGPGINSSLSCSGVVSGTGYDAINTYTCTNTQPLEVNAYEVEVESTGNYYTAPTVYDAITVYDPSLGFATGGGTFELEGDRVNFGFIMRYNPAGKNVRGNLLMVRHHENGTTSRIKSNALGSLALGVDSTVPMGWASFDGKSVYTTWDPVSESYVSSGNQNFNIYVEDRGNPGGGNDRIWIKGPVEFEMPGTLGSASSNTQTLTGGNISVPQPKANGKNNI